MNVVILFVCAAYSFCRVSLLGVSADDCGSCDAGFVCLPGDPIPEQCPRGYYCPQVTNESYILDVLLHLTLSTEVLHLVLAPRFNARSESSERNRFTVDL